MDVTSLINVVRRADGDEDDDQDPALQELYSSWALFILLILLIGALLTSYYVQSKKIRAIHETVISVFVGMVVGLIIRVSPGLIIQNMVSFHSTYFFNVLLPPIILNSGYELHQSNFFRNIGTILTFAFAGTFISAVTLGILVYIFSFLNFENFHMSFVEALSMGATLSATDPVTVLAIFNSYKVDQKLYTIIFGESILNDAVAIVMFETLQKFQGKQLHLFTLFNGITIFIITFFVSLLIGVSIGLMTALLLKYSYLRRYPNIESCIILLMAYASYFFSNGCHMSGVVSLLFCGITLKHYAFYNMSYKAKLSTKYVFRVLAQLSENFIFIYLGMSLFTQVDLVYKPIFILITTIAVTASRYMNVFPLSKLLNRFHRQKDRTLVDHIPYSYQMMLFWAGLRGAVGVALAAGFEGENAQTLKATTLVVVVLTLIIFGGTTSRMLEILNIETGVAADVDSDTEFSMLPWQGTADYDLENGAMELSNASHDSPAAAPNLPVMPDDYENIEVFTEASPSKKISSTFEHYQKAAGAFNQFFHASRDDQAQWFSRFDEEVIKPVLLERDVSKSSPKK
ncbi:CPA1 sodium ion/proton antiporter [Schizosaccharomyces octosporus yFS286]|uniref:Sodium/hydrogen exchanger n=1 Tax=Schizosaccharomyces octosporus (strain yFS286) TaxID=483514 RepID=S9Q1A9_SCHOY|nr:CPA1 sodium ion/proton antiporter [Schizosaccharomyces octosporus yFS286]EPX73942.1 CPA1 sodium ion/proton antiporter [Schizosaccharomyces octosporus yFS286]